MNKMYKLAVVLMKSFGDSVKGKNDKAKQIKRVAMYLLITVAMLPTAGGIGAIAYGMYKGLAPIGQSGLVLGIGMTIVTMTVFFFGIFYVLSVYYFSKDVECLLPLPLTSGQIVGAKFMVTLIFEYLTELVVFAPILIGYGVAANAGVGYYCMGLIVFLLLPVAPLSLASIIDMLIMSFTDIAKNKDRFRMFSAIFGMILALGISFGSQKIGQNLSNAAAIQKLMEQGDNSLLSTMSKLFPTNKLAVMALVSDSAVTGILYLLGFIGAMAICFGVFYGLSGLLYFRGAVGINESASTRRKLGKAAFEKETTKKGSLMAVYGKEMRLLYRNPGYFVNCVLMNFLFPLFIVIPFIAGGKMEPKEIEQLSSIATMPGITFVVAAFITATNSIGSSAISREGRLLYINKFLPLSAKTQLKAKLMTALFFGTIASFLLLLAEGIMFGLGIEKALLGFVICLMATAFTAITGLLLDVTFPKLNWDNELKAVKQNMNVLFLMLITVIVGGLTAFLIGMLRLDYVVASLIIIFVFGAVNAGLYGILITRGATAYSKLEV